jgi:hypothetical protein
MFFTSSKKSEVPAKHAFSRMLLAIFLVILLTLAAIAWTTSRDANAAKGASATRGSAGGVPGPGTRIAGCPVFPKSNAWNRDISKAPVDPRSSEYIRSIGLGTTLHADFGSGQYGDYGIPFRVVGAKQKQIPIHFTAYGDESDKGPYPIPLNSHIEGGGAGDSHVIALQKGTCKLYELYRARRGKGRWLADSGAKFNLRSNSLRPAGWTSADAAGLPIFPGLARADEASSGKITHALRVTVSESQAGYILPARHLASSDTSKSLPPMGLRLRLKSGYGLGRFTGQSLAIMKAMKKYGLIVADNGSDWYISGTPDRRWNDDVLDQLKTVPGRAFEAVKTGRIHH